MVLILTLSADDLPSKGVMGKRLPDPFAVVTVQSTEQGVKPVTVGETEVISNTTSPDFTTRLFVTDYDGSEPMHLVVTIYNQTSKDDKEMICAVPFEVSDVLKADDGILQKEIKDGSGGTVSMRLEETATAGGNATLAFQLRAVKLDNTDGLGMGIKKSDPFFELVRYRHQTARNIKVGDAVYRSSVCSNNLSPVWPAGTVDVDALVGDSGDNDTKFRIVVYDSDDKRSRQLIGQVDVSVNDLIGNVNETALSDIDSMDLTKSFVLRDADGKDETGKIMVLSAEVSDK